MNFGILRVACASPKLIVGNCEYNVNEIIKIVKKADQKKVRLLALPELCITGYTCADLFLQQTLRKSALENLKKLARETAETEVLFTAGLPFEIRGILYNCSAFIHKGKILALIPKTFIPNYSEFYESRWFSSASEKLNGDLSLGDDFDEVCFGSNILLEDKNDLSIKIALEICEDLWVPQSPSLRHALNGATIIVNTSASNEVVGKADYRRLLVRAHSAKTITAYLYASAGRDESTTDLVFGAHNLISLNGTCVSEAEPFSDSEDSFICADLDMEKIVQERIRVRTFSENTKMATEDYSDYRIIPIELADNGFAHKSSSHTIGFDPSLKSASITEDKLLTSPAKHPFVPKEDSELFARCREVVEMQAEGLSKRLRHTLCKTAVIGLSGGLDSTLAILVTERAFEKCSLEKSGIVAVTMPGFGTTDRTYTNACALAKAIGATLKEIPISKAVLQHFKDIGQDKDVHDVTYENAQARERTQILMDIANQNGALVIGTGDLSELALGWCTYNADQMSMYGVNSSIPKTLVKHLVSYFAQLYENSNKKESADILRDILLTPVSPELLPPENGTISQKTEELVGPYELHDFFLYYMLRWGFSPKKIFFLAKNAFPQKNAEEILRWQNAFYRRFFSQQFKRSCMPDGAKVGTVNLSPRGDWRMPSDASAALWISELESLKEEL